MERRNWTLESLQELRYIDSLSDYDRAEGLVVWVEKYTSTLSENEIKIESGEFTQNLPQNELTFFLELFYKNINFIKKYKTEIKSQMDATKKIKTFLH